MCPAFSRRPCGRCDNCERDRWAEVWRALLPEDREWCIGQHLAVAPLGYTRRQAEFDLMPSLTRWVLR